MHIPDGYLSPQTFIPLYGIMLPVWYWGAGVLKKTLTARQIPFLAFGAAFSFVIMMFNVPVPGGSTGHGVGAALIAILLGPWAAFMAVSVALILQALVFGDGGITAIAANCFNIAFIMSFSGYYIYKLLSFNAGQNIPLKILAASVAAYISINLGALFTALDFGIQPYIAHKPDGTPLYCPFGLNIAVPIMMHEHLVYFGFIEAFVTGSVVAYMAKIKPEILNSASPALHGASLNATFSTTAKSLWIGLGILILLTPLGLIASGGAWGEWGTEELHKMTGFIPEGMKRLSHVWHPLLQDYAIPGADGPVMPALGYILSAAIATGLIFLAAFIASKIVCWKKIP